MSDRYTYKVDLPGGQDRLRQMILYVCEKNAHARHFGRIKLNKILWKSDFDAFAERGRPVTGRAYCRLRLGPAPKEMRPLLNEMAIQGLLGEDRTDFGEGVVERRPRALAAPNLTYFTMDDLAFVDRAIEYYRGMTGRETSDDSHGLAWSSRNDGDPMPYESSFLSDEAPLGHQAERLRELIARRGYSSN